MATAWRQGDLIAPGDLQKLGLIDAEDPEVRAIVISHSCDIARGTKQEPRVEVLLGRVVPKASSQFENAHAVRKLHVKAEPPNGGAPEWVELSILDRREVGKELLLACRPWSEQRLGNREHRALRQWLAQRYSRAAFPDEVVQALKRSAIETQLLMTASKHGTAIVGFYFDVPDADPSTGALARPIKLSIQIVYDAAKEADKHSAEQAAREIADVFEAHEMAAADQQCEPELELGSCVALSDQAMRLADARRLRRWRFEYLSLDGQPIDDSE
jgi:hypothetical protein